MVLGQNPKNFRFAPKFAGITGKIHVRAPKDKVIIYLFTCNKCLLKLNTIIDQIRSEFSKIRALDWPDSVQNLILLLRNFVIY